MSEQRKVFRDFMLGIHESPSAGGGNSTTAATLPSTPSKSSGSAPKQRVKKFYSLYLAFRRTLKDWLDVDDQLQRVMNAIANLRERCWATSKAIVHHEPASTNKTWRGFGYRTLERTSDLNELQESLTDDLIHHEKMVGLARQLLASLAQEQEAMGRRFNELFVYYLDSGNLFDIPVDEEAASKLEECRQLYAATAMELCRKQTEAQKVFESIHDRLLYPDDDDSIISEENSPRVIAELCARKWPRDRSKYIRDCSKQLEEFEKIDRSWD